MKYLLDTNVLSELRLRAGSLRVRAWVRARADADLAISVITVTELEMGILSLARRDPLSARRLRDWLEADVLDAFAGRILPVDLAAARRTATLHVPDAVERHDALIAGTALAHGLTVVTRNVRDFERTGVPVLNPWA